MEGEIKSDETTNEQNLDSTKITKSKKAKFTALSAFMEEQPVCDRNDKPSELESYLNIQLKIDTNNFDLKKWWFENKDEFPNLVKMYCQYLSIPATSAPSERNFSDAGLIVTKRRNSLLPKTIRSLVIARNVLKNK